MFINEYFNIEKADDDFISIRDKDGILYEWGKDAVWCHCPEHDCEDSPFLLVKYNDKTWSLCHAEKGPMPDATHIPEKEDGWCPIEFHDDLVGDCEYTVNNHTYDFKTSCGGYFKKIVAGFLALGAMLVGVESVFKACLPADREQAVSQGEKDNKKQQTENKEEYIDCSKDTCMIKKSPTKAVVQNIVSGFRIRD